MKQKENNKNTATSHHPFPRLGYKTDTESRITKKPISPSPVSALTLTMILT